ncbi:MAG: exosortase/archaeosortase family protein [Phycisphaeraceae bacterium]|nr:MAG: exosortase/archaeosortase family protein [Phycisphaeraceae bacterium]
MSDAAVAKGEGWTLAALLREHKSAVIVSFIALTVAFFLLFFRWHFRQMGPSGFSVRYPEDWGHAYLVPVISTAFAWKHRAAIFGTRLTRFWPGLAMLCGGIVIYSFFLFGFPNHMFQGFASLLALAGVVLFVGGPKFLGLLAFPIAYLALGVTVSDQVMNGLTFQLKIMASQASAVVLSIVGIDNTVAGNMLTIFTRSGEEIPLNVAEACSGMRMVIAFIALAVAVAFFGLRYWWQRIAVICLAIPVALGMNVARVVVLAIASMYDPELARGEAHTLIGTLLLVPSFFLFMGVVWVLGRIVKDDRPEHAGVSA